MALRLRCGECRMDTQNGEKRPQPLLLVTPKPAQVIDVGRALFHVVGRQIHPFGLQPSRALLDTLCLRGDALRVAHACHYGFVQRHLWAVE